MYLWSLILQDEGHLDTNFLIYILTFYHEYLLFQFFSRDMRMYIPILQGFKMDA